MRRPALFAAGAVLASTLLVAGFATLQSPSHLLGGVCLVPFLAALERIQRLRWAVVLGAVMAVGYTVASIGWFPTAIARYTGASPALAAVLLIVSAPLLQPQFMALAVVRTLLRGRETTSDLHVAFGSALAYVGVEWLAPRLFDDTLGYGLYPAEWLRQAADLGGARGLTLVLLLVNEALLLLMTQRRRALVRSALLVTPLVLATVYGACRWSSSDEPAAGAEQVRVGLVQANLTRYGELAERLGTYDAVRLILDSHYALSDRALKQAPMELLVWPETVYPTTFGAPKSEVGAELDDELRAFADRTSVPLLFGAYASDEGREFNAAVLLQGRADRAQVYRKARPFPLTEYVPPLLDRPSLRALFPWMGTWSPGPGAQLLTVRREGRSPLTVAPLICFDAAAPGLVADSARQGAKAIVTLANDAWFAGTPGSRQHLVVSAFRSIETRLPQVRATNSGISAEIDVLGRIVRHTEEDRPEVLHAALWASPNPPETLAVRWGDWLGAPALILGGALLVFRRRLSRQGA